MSKSKRNYQKIKRAAFTLGWDHPDVQKWSSLLLTRLGKRMKE